MSIPTLAEQRGLASVLIVGGSMSAISCAYVIHHLLFKDYSKLKRLYHRLVLAMNISLLILSLTAIWAPFAVPEGTEGFVLASGTIGTCTASGFFQIALTLTIPVYYASLSLQAYMGLRNGLKEEKYQWIEKWVHLLALGFPIAIASIFAAKENINPDASFCYTAKAPVGCEGDSDVPCERGDLGKLLTLIPTLALIFLYFIFPPAVTISMHYWVRKCKQRAEASTGWIKIKESARIDMMQNVTKQISLYLSSFWLTWILTLIYGIYHMLTSEDLYSVLIAANLVYYLQGCVYAVVYFLLERMGKPKIYTMTKSNLNSNNQMTVENIRANAEKQQCTLESVRSESDRSRERISFNIFDGEPDPNSPWAKFIYDYDEDEEHQNNDAQEDLVQ